MGIFHMCVWFEWQFAPFFTNFTFDTFKRSKQEKQKSSDWKKCEFQLFFQQLGQLSLKVKQKWKNSYKWKLKKKLYRICNFGPLQYHIGHLWFHYELSTNSNYLDIICFVFIFFFIHIKCFVNRDHTTP